MDVMLLAAGRSTRLGALGQALPKPLVPVCGVPAIRYGLEAVRRAGLRQAVINVFHHGELLRAALGDGTDLGVSIRYSAEEELLGTGGGIARARATGLLGRGPLLVINAKVVADVDLGAILDAHTRSGAAATMVLRDVPDPRAWGAITAEGRGRVIAVLDAISPVTPMGALTERMFTGIHVLGPELLERLPPAGASDVIKDAYMPAVRDGADVRALVLPGYFAEHSTPERYLAGNLALLAQPDLLPHPPAALVGVDPGAAVDASAHVEGPVRIVTGATVEAGASVGPGVVVGAGARVAAGARVRRTVVWPGAVASGDLEDAVVTADGAIQVGGRGRH